MLATLFGLDSRASIENPRFNINDPRAWDMLGSSQTDSGQRINHEKALTYAPVWQATTLISGAGAKLPIELFKRTGDDMREQVYAHPSAKLVRYQANRERTAFEFWRTVWVHLCLYNRAFAYIEQRRPGMPLELFNLLPDRTCPERISGDDVYSQTNNRDLANAMDGQLVYTTEAGGQLKTLYPSQVLDFKGITLDGMTKCDLVEHARNAIGLGLAQEKFSSKFFRNGARMGGTLEIPAAIGKPAAQTLEEGWRKNNENEDSWFRTVILRDGAKFHAGSFAPKESQLIEATEAQVRNVARWFNLPPSKLGISGSVSYNSKTEDNQNFLDDTLSATLAMICAELWFKLLSEAEQVDHYFEYDTTALLRMDTTKRYSAYEVGLRARFLSRNEVRKKENLPPVDGGDEFDVVPGGVAGGTPGGAPASGPADDPEEQEPDEPTDVETDEEVSPERSILQRFRKVVYLVGQRARHKAKNPRAFDQWVTGGMNDLRDEARKAGASDTESTDLFADIVTRLDRIAQTTTEAKLADAVDTAMAELERNAE